MKRTRSRAGDRNLDLKFLNIQQDNPQNEVLGVDETLSDRLSIKTAYNLPVSPPLSPEHGGRPSKLQRHGSKILSVLRSMTNSGMCKFFKSSKN